MGLRVPDRIRLHAGVDGGGHLADHQGRWDLGHQYPDRLGIRDRQLRLVDRYRPRRHADLGDSSSAQPVVAQCDQSLRRSHDDFRGIVRGHVPGAAYRPPMAGVLAAAVSEYDVALAAIPQPAGLGRVRGLDVPDDLGGVLVYRPDSRFRDSARFGQATLEGRDLRRALHGMAQLGAPLAEIRKSRLAAGRTFDAAGGFSPHGREFRLRGGNGSGLAYHDLPALFRRRRDLLGLRDGADVDDPGP